MASVTRHLSRAVNKHEGVHEDVPIVGEPTKLVSFGTKASGRLNELRPRRVNNLLRACNRNASWVKFKMATTTEAGECCFSLFYYLFFNKEEQLLLQINK